MSVSSTARRRLLVLTSTFPRWERDTEPAFVFELSRRLARTFEVIVIAPHARGAAVRETLAGMEIRRYRYAPANWETLTHSGGIVANLKRERWKWLLVPVLIISQYVAIRAAMRAWKPHIVHAHWIVPQAYVATLALGDASRSTLVTTSHGVDLFALRGRVLSALKRFVLRRSRATTVVSHVMRDLVVALGADPERVSIAPMGVDLAQLFVPDERQPRTKGEILFVGRLVEKKGVRHLIDALPSIVREMPEACLIIAGSGPEEPALRSQVEQLGLEGHVSFLGPVQQHVLPSLYRRASVFAAPFVEGRSGDQEGLGLVVVEALGCGCPVIASDLPAVRDVLDETAADCRVEPGNVEALAHALLRVLSEPENAMRRARALRSSLVERFDWESVAERYRSILFFDDQNETT